MLQHPIFESYFISLEERWNGITPARATIFISSSITLKSTIRVTHYHFFPLLFCRKMYWPAPWLRRLRRFDLFRITLKLLVQSTICVALYNFFPHLFCRKMHWPAPWLRRFWRFDLFRITLKLLVQSTICVALYHFFPLLSQENTLTCTVIKEAPAVWFFSDFIFVIIDILLFFESAGCSCSLRFCV